MKNKSKLILENAGLLYVVQEAHRISKTLLTKNYLKRPKTWGRGMKQIDKRIAISLSNNFTYIRIPKCANSKVTYTIANYLPVVDNFDEENTYVRDVKKSFDNISNISNVDMENVISNHYIFTIVRNPYTRILSAYLDKMKKYKYRRRFGKEIKKYGNNKVTFRSFCRWLHDKGYWRDPHWMPQSWYLNVFGNDRIDYVGKVERLKKDINKVLKKLCGNEGKFDLIDPVFEDNCVHETNATYKSDDIYDSESRRLVYETYRNDFDVLSYDPLSI